MNKRGDKGKGSGGGKLEKGGGAERGKRSERRKDKGEERRCGKRRGGEEWKKAGEYNQVQTRHSARPHCMYENFGLGMRLLAS